MLDRAEEVFVKLRDTPHRAAALKALLDVYQQEKDWEKTIGVATELGADQGHPGTRKSPNFHCELAAIEMTHSRADAAVARLEQALKVNRKCARANVLLGDIHAAAGDHAAAIEAWKRIEQQKPAYLALVARRLLESLPRAGQERRGAEPAARLSSRVRLRWICSTWCSRRRLRRRGRRRHTRWCATSCAATRRCSAWTGCSMPNCWWSGPNAAAIVQLVKNLVHSHTQRVARYSCENCGFKARQFYWHCPACGGWETYPPRRSEEFDLTRLRETGSRHGRLEVKAKSLLCTSRWHWPPIRFSKSWHSECKS